MSVVFDRAADYYDDTRGFPPGEVARIGALFRDVGHLTTQSRVLEIGIGTGRVALPLSAHTRVFGIDLSRPMLDRLRAKRANEPVYPARGDATRLPFPDAMFDAVVAVHVFHLIPDWQGALREVARVLTPGGALLNGWNDDERRDEAGDLLWNAWDSVVGPMSTRNVGVAREQYATFLADSGWREIGEPLTCSYTITRSPQDFLDRLEGRVWSSMWRLPDDVIAQGIAAVRAAMREHRIDAQATLVTEASFRVRRFAPPV
jgi:ubiquinone/menaquinone biosynthesis C-methylase UbiE